MKVGLYGLLLIMTRCWTDMAPKDTLDGARPSRHQERRQGHILSANTAGATMEHTYGQLCNQPHPVG
eukprot:4684523-Amphidinium_carterae.2